MVTKVKGSVWDSADNGLAVNVKDFGATGLNVVDDSSAFIAAVNSLPSTGGEIIVPDGEYRLEANIPVNQSKFTNGNVVFRLSRNAKLRPIGVTSCISFIGANAASPMPYCGVLGGQILSNIDDCSYAIYGQYVSHFKVLDTVIYGFKNTSTLDGKAGIYIKYGIYLQFQEVKISGCSSGYRIENDDAAIPSYRSTTTTISGGRIGSCHYGVAAYDVFNLIINNSCAIEYNGIGVYLTGHRTTGVNCVNLTLVGGYFEKNGVHVVQNNVGTARSKGAIIANNLFENISATDSSGSPYLTSNAGDYKLILSGEDGIISGNYWSSLASINDILLQVNSDNNIITRQGRDNAGFSVSDLGTNNVHEYANYSTQTNYDGDTSPDLSTISMWSPTYSAPTTITDFDGGYTGQIVHVRPLNGNITIKHTPSGTGIRTANKANDTITAGDSRVYVNWGSSIWSEVGGGSGINSSGSGVISSGALVVSANHMTVTGEGGVADDLDVITGGVDGMRIILQANDSANTITLRDTTTSGATTNGIQLAGAASYALDHAYDTIELIYRADFARWCEISRSNNL